MELRALILTPWMQPHGIATWQQAIVLQYQSKVDVLETYDAEVSSPSVTLRVPAVLRLRRDVHTHKKGVKFSRINVYTRDFGMCSYCGKKRPWRELNYDHVVPRSQGGPTTWENVLTSCRKCNLRKGNRTPEQAGMIPIRKPYRPRTLPMVLPMLVDLAQVPEQWLPYLNGHAQTA